MSEAPLKAPVGSDLLPVDLLPLCAEAHPAAESFGEAARRAVARLVAPCRKVDADLLAREPFAAHGYAWHGNTRIPPPNMLRCAERRKWHRPPGAAYGRTDRRG